MSRISIPILILITILGWGCIQETSSPTGPSSRVDTLIVVAGYGTTDVHLGASRTQLESVLGMARDSSTARFGYRVPTFAVHVTYDSLFHAIRIEFAPLKSEAAAYLSADQPSGVGTWSTGAAIGSVLGTGRLEGNALLFNSLGLGFVSDSATDQVTGLLVFSPVIDPAASYRFTSVQTEMLVDYDQDGYASTYRILADADKSSGNGTAFFSLSYRTSSADPWRLFLQSEPVTITGTGNSDRQTLWIGGTRHQTVDIMVRLHRQSDSLVLLDTIITGIDEESPAEDMALATCTIPDENDVDGDGYAGSRRVYVDADMPLRHSVRAFMRVLRSTDAGVTWTLAGQTDSLVTIADTQFTDAKSIAVLGAGHQQSWYKVEVVRAADSLVLCDSVLMNLKEEDYRQDAKVSLSLEHLVGRVTVGPADWDGDSFYSSYSLQWGALLPDYARDSLRVVLSSSPSGQAGWTVVARDTLCVGCGLLPPQYPENAWSPLTIAAHQRLDYKAELLSMDGTVLDDTTLTLGEEPVSEDIGYQIKSAAFSGKIDHDGDGYCSLYNLIFDVNRSSGSDSVYAVISFHEAGATAWIVFDTTEMFLITDTSSADARTDSLVGGYLDNTHQSSVIRIQVFTRSGQEVASRTTSAINEESIRQDATYELTSLTYTNPVDNDRNGFYSSFRILYGISITSADDVRYPIVDSVYVKISMRYSLLAGQTAYAWWGTTYPFPASISTETGTTINNFSSMLTGVQIKVDLYRNDGTLVDSIESTWKVNAESAAADAY